MRRPLHTDEGGSGYTSGDPSKTRWANWATAYVKYCDGGSMTGTKEDSTPQRNGSSGPLWCKCLVGSSSCRLSHELKQEALHRPRQVQP